ncbi:D-tyrosyl-tRNA(Tyr) deacylase [Horticoccus luteus]|uniref:D-aminoacyl-tRNA deacylase n=1 Tax=Horticoccus luteus TaxID=2862869 RepID=A0A8F9TTD3_9BACT|nr:D-aminoacyl-tRNA deacylase [Horticoccus luteus]QYM77691.1 D-tyrosyl-tRNA(Tyr) deacylase [Horticoccus luteus]
MRVVLQRVSQAHVTIAGRVVGRIDRGLLILLGIAAGDTLSDAEWLVRKIVGLRIFPDDAGALNRSVQDVAGDLLVISQFTLIASTRKGTRPSFNDAARLDAARPLYEQFLDLAATALGRPVAAGEFGADMQVALVNDGPVTIVIDSRQRE